MPVAFRSIRETDAQGIHTVALESWRYTYGEIFSRQFIERFVNRNYSVESILSLMSRIQSDAMFFEIAECAGETIGFCNIGIREQSAELLRIYLLPACIGQGIGRRLLERGEAFLKQHGVKSYFCFVHAKNKIGKSFYVNMGFKHIPENDRDDEWFMEKRVSAK